MPKAKQAKRKEKSIKPRCGLCGSARKKLMKTECCGSWICDDHDKYVIFSYARNSCARNHDRYTLCASHAMEKHHGKWQTCAQCRANFDTEDYVWYGTNEYNFEKLENPPKFKPTLCAKCGNVIDRGEDGYTTMPDGKYFCEQCYPMFRV